MELKEFIENFVARNTLVRFWTKIKGGHELVGDKGSLQMEWEAKKSKLATRKVLGVTDILVPGPYSEAVNIVIE